MTDYSSLSTLDYLLMTMAWLKSHPSTEEVTTVWRALYEPLKSDTPAVCFGVILQRASAARAIETSNHRRRGEKMH